MIINPIPLTKEHYKKYTYFADTFGGTYTYERGARATNSMHKHDRTQSIDIIETIDF